MTKSGKAPTILLVFLLLISSLLAAVMYYYFNNERVKRVVLEEQLEEAQLIKEGLEGKFKITKKEISSLSDELSEAKLRITHLSSQLDTEKRIKKQISLERDKSIIELSNKSVSLQELKDKLSETQEQIANLEKQIAQSYIEKGLEAEARRPEQSEEIELGEIVVYSGEIFEGKILTVNKEHSFVVIDLGLKDGIRLGQNFSVYNGEIFSGDIQVVDVKNELSVANLLGDRKGYSIQIGDKVIAK